MVYRDVRVGLRQGLHVVPAYQFAKIARKYRSKVSLQSHRGTFEVKTGVDALKAFVRMGDTVTVVCDGPDERAASRELAHFLEG